MYVILLFLGLLIGAVFLVVLLIGDRREARLEAQRKLMQEQIAGASQPVEGAWPPPPSAEAVPTMPPPSASAKPKLAPGTTTKIIRAFFRFRSYAAATIVVAYIIYSSYPRLNFGWILLAAAIAFVVLAIVVTKLQQSRQPANRL